MERIDGKFIYPLICSRPLTKAETLLLAEGFELPTYTGNTLSDIEEGVM